MQGFDLTKNNLSNKAEEGYEFEVRLPGGDEPTGAFIKVRGNLSKTVKAYARRKFQEFQVQQKRNKKKGQEDDIDLEEAEEMAIESAIVRTIGWRGFVEDGKPVEFSQENAHRVYKEHSWIRDQVLEEAEQLINFQ